MGLVWVGDCDRCESPVSEKPGLGYADRKGRFGFCDKCLKETGLGYRSALDRGSTMNHAWWLETVLPGSNEVEKDWLLGKAKVDWYRLKDVECHCGQCSIRDLKTYGECKGRKHD